MVKPVAIYADEGTSEIGVASLIEAVPQFLNRPVVPILASKILAGRLSDYAMLIIPGGADLPYCRKLNGEGNRQIRQFVVQGGIYLGICAGAYYACQQIDFVGKDYSVKGERELGFFAGLAQGCLPEWTNGKRFDESVKSKNAVEINFINGERETIYYHGGPRFIPFHSARYQTIATYPDGELAMIAGKIGKGLYFLSGVHFELQAETYQQTVQQAILDEQPQEQKILHYLQNYSHTTWKLLKQLDTDS
ncbi:hypothetical protein A1D29_01725 [Pasteurellaceae bacterium Orientalotternb1]|nr:hypothetical protein A1D29_01725 [Pasteurellaceae bacterium Orientalotternb1]